MAANPTYVQSASNLTGVNTVGMATFAAATKAGNGIIMSVMFASITINITAVTDQGNNVYTRIFQVRGATQTQEIWYTSSTLGANSTLQVLVTSSATIAKSILIAEYTNPISIDNSTSATGSSTAPATSSIAMANANDTLIGTLVCPSGTRTAQLAGFTDRVNQGTQNFISDDQVSSSGSYSYSATLSASGNWICALVGLTGLPPRPMGADLSWI